MNRRKPQVLMDGSDELGAILEPEVLARPTPTRMVGGHNTVTKDTEVPSQVNSGHTPAAANPADRQARKDF